MAVGETTRRRERVGTGEEELDPVFRRGGLWEQPKCPAEPPRSAIGRESCSGLAGFAQDRNGTDVALAAGALDVMR